jgi:hypothetical protein
MTFGLISCDKKKQEDIRNAAPSKRIMSYPSERVMSYKPNFEKLKNETLSTDLLTTEKTPNISAMVERETSSIAYTNAFLKVLKNQKTQKPKNIKLDLHEIKVPASYPQYILTLDKQKQRIGLDILEDRVRREYIETLHPSIANVGRHQGMLPASALGVKAKQFDDGLYAAVELAADVGIGSFPGRHKLLINVLAKLLKGEMKDEYLEASAILAAATKLGGLSVQIPAKVQNLSNLLQREFLTEPFYSKPLGFYTWTDSLYKIFQRDRLLQSQLSEKTAKLLVSTLNADESLASAYNKMVRLVTRLTNPLVTPDLLSSDIPSEGRAFLPPSRSFEADLFMRLTGGGYIPNGFNLANEMVKRIRANTLNLSPKTNSGWYDYQVFALETLVAPERAIEAPKLYLTTKYKKELVGLFKSLLALTRETHVKQLAIPEGATAPYDERVRPRLHITPSLSVEPLVTYYLRRARSYRFIRSVLDEAFGNDAWKSLRRVTAAGSINLDLGDELSLMESLFYGAYVQSCIELGIQPDFDNTMGYQKFAHAARALFELWRLNAHDDPDLTQDVRMMVPVFYDKYQQKMKVWAVLGVDTKPVKVWYQHTPTIKMIRTASGKLVAQNRVEVLFKSETWNIPYLVSAEVYVSKLMNRKEFRALCDKHKNSKAILAALK